MKYQFGEKLRQVRERKKLTMKKVAAKAGVSESLISQIERNKVSPAIDTLLNLAEVLEIDLEYLFSEFKRNRTVNLVKAEDRSKIALSDVSYEQLSKTVEGEDEHGIEAYYMEIAVGGSSGSTEYGHQGKELGVIIEGEGEFKIGSETYQLHPGDSLSFASDVPHRFTNIGDHPLKAFWVITPPKQFMGDLS